MTQEQKELLIKDLCARLPYGVKVNVKGVVYDNRICSLTDIHHGLDTYIAVSDGMQYHIENIKPYLFPLSNMTEEQKKEYCSLVWFDGLSAGWNRDDAVVLNEVEMLIDFYHKNHLDWRGLIEKGLANDATGLNIY